MKYTDADLRRIKQLREVEELTWKEIATIFNDELGEDESRRTPMAMRKTYYRAASVLSDLNVTEVDDDTVNVALESVYRSTHKNKQLSRQNQVLTARKVLVQDFVSALKKINQECPIMMHPSKIATSKKTQFNRTILAHISDTHIGVNINRHDMGGVNSIGALEISRRFAFLFKEIAHYKIQHRDDSDLVLVVNGDILQGVIHDMEAVMPMATQYSLALRVFSQGISYVASHFKQVTVVCTTGNHDRYMHKSNKGRQSNQKWDSFTTNLYVSLKEVFKNYSNIQFDIPATPYALFSVRGHKIFATHGDTVLNVGNPGKSINIENITNQLNRINTSLKQDIKIVMVGHVHKATVQVLDNGMCLLINGTLSGTDPFAQSIGILSNHPIQQIIEVTEEFPVGDIRFVRVSQADDDESMDKIIKPMLEIF